MNGIRRPFSAVMYSARQSARATQYAIQRGAHNAPVNINKLQFITATDQNPQKITRKVVLYTTTSPYSVNVMLNNNTFLMILWTK